MQLIGQDPLSDPQMKEAFSGINLLSQIIGDKPVPLLFDFVSNSNYRFFASLSHQYLKCDLLELQGEATIFGKVYRFIDEGKKEKVFSLIPEIDALVPTNRKQRRASKSKRSQDTFVEVLKGPAMILIPIAIYR